MFNAPKYLLTWPTSEVHKNKQLADHVSHLAYPNLLDTLDLFRRPGLVRLRHSALRAMGPLARRAAGNVEPELPCGHTTTPKHYWAPGTKERHNVQWKLMRKTARWLDLWLTHEDARTPGHDPGWLTLNQTNLVGLVCETAWLLWLRFQNLGENLGASGPDLRRRPGQQTGLALLTAAKPWSPAPPTCPLSTPRNPCRG